jgi:DNA-binding NarL/FixJ family response regulator
VNTNTTPLRLLLVDDHPMVRTGIRAALRHHLPDARIEEAGCATEALEKLAAFRPRLALLDINLPGMNGLDLARRIRDRCPQVSILLVAAEADPWTVSEGMRAGASGFVAKSNSADLLPQAVRKVLAGETFLCPEASAALQRAEHYDVARTEPPGPAVLSTREREVLRCLAQGENTKTIASLLQLSPKTVETHRQHIMSKLGLQSVAALTRYAVRHKMLPA